MIRVHTSQEDLTRAVAEHITLVAQETVAARGVFRMVLAGGGTPRPVYELLVTDEYRNRIDWHHVQAFFGDERCVAPDHEDSNYRMAQTSLLQSVPIPPGNVFRMRGELAPQTAATDYERVLKSIFRDGIPIFDLVLLGMGADGHTLSLFPHTTAIHEQERLVVANQVQHDKWRITLTAPVVNMARQVRFLISGEDKAAALKEVIQGAYQPEKYPSQLIKPDSGGLLFMVDRDAASLLDRVD